jgi:hypothetical protein
MEVLDVQLQVQIAEADFHIALYRNYTPSIRNYWYIRQKKPKISDKKWTEIVD